MTYSVTRRNNDLPSSRVRFQPLEHAILYFKVGKRWKCLPNFKGHKGSSVIFEVILNPYSRRITSSPQFPQSNGRAEAAVKLMKKIIRQTWDAQQRHLNKEAWTRALVQYRNTPGVTGLFPAQRLFGHPLQDLVPAHCRSFAPCCNRRPVNTLQTREISQSWFIFLLLKN